MIPTVSKFRDSLAGYYEKIAEQKKATGRPVVGCMPMFFPEELIHASGATPVVIQESDEIITQGSRHMDSFYCGVVLSVTDLVVKGKLDFLDMLIVPDTCVQQRGMAQVLRHLRPDINVELVQLPRRLRTQDAMELAIGRLEKIRGKLRQLTGSDVGDDKIEQSILVYKENRMLLRELYQLRREKPGILKGNDMAAIVQSAMLMPTEEHSEYLRALMAELEKAAIAAEDSVRLYVSGHFCAPPKREILELIEEAGAVIVDDDLYNGYRYFAEDITDGSSPIERLARRYVYPAVPNPTRLDVANDWRTYIVKAVTQARAQGVVILLQRHCDPHMIWYPDIRNALLEAGVPSLMVETGHEDFALAGERTRIQKLVDTIKRAGQN